MVPHGLFCRHSDRDTSVGDISSARSRSVLITLGAGQEVTCLFSFIGDEQADELSFESGERLVIVDSTDCDRRGWLLVRNRRNIVGRVPCCYVRSANEETAPKYPWLLESATRSESEQLLQDREPGTFLLRASEHFPGSYTLSIKGDKVEHYRVKCSDGMFTIDDETFFPDILKLIEHYERDADGLCTNLVMPVLWHLVNSNDDWKETTKDRVDWNLFKRHNAYVSPDNLKLTRVIGEGEHGKVYLGQIGKDQKYVAIKTLKNSKAMRTFLREASMMLSLDFPNLVKFYGVTSTNGCVCIVMEYMVNGSVLDYLITRGRSVIPAEQLKRFARDTCLALDYLERNKAVHRDVAASNVLLDENMMAKLSDFGLSVHADADASESVGKVRVKWTAPEALEKKIYTSKSDVWSFGIFLWELYSFGRQPYPRIPVSQVLHYIKNGNRMDPPNDCPQLIASLMLLCWQALPERRPHFSELLIALSDDPVDANNNV